MFKCPSCETNLRPTARVCIKCGYKVTEENRSAFLDLKSSSNEPIFDIPKKVVDTHQNNTESIGALKQSRNLSHHHSNRKLIFITSGVVIVALFSYYIFSTYKKQGGNDYTESVSLNNQVNTMPGITQDISKQTLAYSHGLYVGEVFSGMANGQGVYTAAISGTIYEGQFVNDTFKGIGSMTWINGDKFIGVWSNDVGISGTMNFANGRVVKGKVLSSRFYPNTN